MQATPAPDLVRTPEGTAVRTGDGRWFRLNGEPAPEQITAQIHHLHDRRATWADCGPRHLHLHTPGHATHPLLDRIADTLRRHQIDITLGEPPTRPADALVVLDHDHTRRATRPLTAAHANTHIYREGDLWFVDPLHVAPDDPTASQVTRRRLAASQAPREQLTWWQQHDPGDDLDHLDESTTWRIVHRIVDILHAEWTGPGTRPAHRRTLWRHDHITGTTSTHPVLGFPEPAPLPPRAPST
ncbi:hypothetical protein SAMN05421595_2203 [Austwickia chelonae]|uniref:Uncharacterized protein n=1 Tax=Austwickia chelonae NBRC 105200 TaxID=1184607 RepID=K6VK35_9MICO|nr:hypothetical protein [Austwickia chelonae]GAB77064.1 hypothetical protein AUCHE_04_01050 [Austwickia chelonae NBRC 105200]SEW33735.1 hypothetical protein SAMN05421595_2203 [Austwickia chelonae]